MADANVEKTTIDLGIRYDGQTTDESLKFIAQGEVVLFDGFLKVYRDSSDDEDNAAEELTSVLPAMNRGDIVERKEISAMQRFSQPPLRFTEASLVKKLEELGIGRPSTTATIISTIQQRGYVQKGDKKGDTHPYTIDTLKGQKIDTREKKEVVGNEKGKLIPTDIGIVVNDFLMDNFSEIMDYNFTANVEQKFDQIAKGKTEWKAWMREFDRGFEPEVDKVLNARSEHKVGERQLGIDPKSGRVVYVKIGRFGPVIQIGDANDADKPLFAQLPPEKSMDEITLDEAMELFRLPLTVGEFEGKPVVIGTGRFGPYIMHDKKFVSLPNLP
jgi:DNA topoisomerase-1